MSVNDVIGGVLFFPVLVVDVTIVREVLGGLDEVIEGGSPVVVVVSVSSTLVVDGLAALVVDGLALVVIGLALVVIGLALVVDGLAREVCLGSDVLIGLVLVGFVLVGFVLVGLESDDWAIALRGLMISNIDNPSAARATTGVIIKIQRHNVGRG